MAFGEQRLTVEQRDTNKLAGLSDIKISAPTEPTFDPFAGGEEVQAPRFEPNTFASLAGRNPGDIPAQEVEFFNEAMAQYGINTPQRQAHFLSQVFHESGGLQFQEELNSGAAYEGRRDLGNTQPGDGVKFKGRGPIQLTGRANYRELGRALGVDLEANPELVATDPKIRAQSAAWFWSKNGLNELSDTGSVEEVTQIVNGGQRGLQDRKEKYQAIVDTLGVDSDPFAGGEEVIDPFAGGVEVTDPFAGGVEVTQAGKQGGEGFVPPTSDNGLIANLANVFSQSALSQVGEAAKGLARAAITLGSSAFGVDPRVATDVLDELHPLYRVGQFISEGAQEMFPANPEYQDKFVTKLAAGFGQYGTVAATALATGGAGGVVSATGAAFAQANMEYDAAKQAGASEDDAFNAFLLNLPVGATEAIPMGKLFRRLDNITGGGIKSLLAKGAAGFSEEAFQEMGQTALQNAVAGGTYDATRGILDGVVEAGLLGGIIGGTVTGVSVGVKQAAVEARNRAERADAELAAQEVDRAAREQARQREGDAQIISETEGAPVRPSYEDSVEGEIGSLPVIPEPSKPEDISPDNSSVDLNMDQGLGTWRQKIFGWMDRRNFLPESMRKMLEHSRSQMSREIVQMRVNQQRLVDGIRKMHIGENVKQKRASAFVLSKEFESVPEAVWTEINAVLQGQRHAVGEFQPTSIQPSRGVGDPLRSAAEPRTQQVVPTLPYDPTLINEEVYQAVMDMRSHIDGLSRELVKRGLVEGPLAAQITKNVGFYIHRTYQKHKVKGWENKVEAHIVTRAFDYIQNAYKAKGINLTQADTNRIINRIMRGPDGELEILTNKMVGLDTSPLRRRDNTLAPEIRALMGEIGDPLTNYVTTASKVANLVHNGSFLKDIANQFKGTYFFDENNYPPAFHKRISDESDSSLGAIAGLYTHPDIYEALKPVTKFADKHSWLTPLIRANGIAKYSKTVVNQITHARNVLGGGYFLAFNGILPGGKDLKEGFKVFKSTSLDIIPKEFEKQMLRYAELGLDVEGSLSGELKNVFSTFNPDDPGNFWRNFDHLSATKKSIYGKTALAADTMSSIYKAEDVGMRIIMYEALLSKYKRAYANDPNAPTEAQLEQQVADIVKGTYQDYSRVPEKIQNLSRFPLVGAFVSFQSEVVRTTFNTYKIAQKELASDNPEIQKIGRQRIMGAAVTLLSGVAASAASAMLLGIGPEEDEDIKRFVAPWDASSPLIYLTNEPGSVRYINPSYYNPWALLSDPVVGMIQGKADDTILDAYIRAGTQLVKPFFGEELVTKKLRELLANKRDTGSRIYNPQAGFGDQAVDALAHIWEGLEPGLVRSSGRVLQSLDGKRTRGGKELSPNEEIMGWFGLRTIKADIANSYGFRANDFARAARDSKSIYTSALNDPNPTPAKAAAALAAANRAYKDAFDQAVLDMEAATRLGVTYRDIEQTLRDNGVSKQRVKELRSRVFRPIRPEIRK